MAINPQPADGRNTRPTTYATTVVWKIFHRHGLSEYLSEGTASFHGLNGSGIVISKIMSCMNPKRTRDIYDMCLEWKQGADMISKDIVALHGEYTDVAKWVSSLVSFIDKKPDYFPQLVELHAEPYGMASEAVSAYHNFTDFIRTLGCMA
jgi:hypothetical protein